MTIKEVREMLLQIEASKSDDEKAHGMRDYLWHRVLEKLAEDGSELAHEALKSEYIDFARLCA